MGKCCLGWDRPINSDQQPLIRIKIAKDAAENPEDHKTWVTLFSNPIEGGSITRGSDTYFGTDVPNCSPYCYIENSRTLKPIPPRITMKCAYQHATRLSRACLATMILVA